MSRLLAICLLMPLMLQAQLVPQEPVKNFQLPMFGENGYRTWELSGDEGRYISADKIEVSQMKMKVFSGDASSTIENRIESPLAMLFVSKNIAIGQGPIRITATTYRIDGQRWFWDGKTRSVVVSQKASVIFYEKFQ